MTACPNRLDLCLVMFNLIDLTESLSIYVLLEGPVQILVGKQGCSEDFKCSVR